MSHIKRLKWQKHKLLIFIGDYNINRSWCVKLNEQHFLHLLTMKFPEILQGGITIIKWLIDNSRSITREVPRVWNTQIYTNDRQLRDIAWTNFLRIIYMGELRNLRYWNRTWMSTDKEVSISQIILNQSTVEGLPKNVRLITFGLWK